jgi:hypothetical protein
MITPYDDVHYMFLDRLEFELYDEETRDRIYNFYEKYDVNVYLPRQLDQKNTLKYIIEFKEFTDAFWVIIGNGGRSVWKVAR